MYCPNCGAELKQRTGDCGECGGKLAKSRKTLPLFLTIFSLFIAAGILFYFFQPLTLNQLTHHMPDNELLEKQAPELTGATETTKDKPPQDVAEMISSAQTKVFTIFTDYGQGSGFLIDQNGHILTNAHVVEGDLFPIIRMNNGDEYEGKVIGYSNTTDVAVIQAKDLAGKMPLPLEESANSEIGDEVIALGSPQGYESTATLGNISGIDRNFVISPFTYEGVYQTSAPIAPGSSGGPLLSKTTGKAIAINSARDEREVNIGFSIPIHQILSTVNQWIATPMAEDEIYALFYYSDGYFYFGDYLDDYGYFDDYGYYSDEYDYYYYDDWDWDDDFYYDDWDWYDDYYEDDSYWENSYDEYWDWEDDYEYSDDDTYDDEIADEYDFEEDYEYEDDAYEEYWDDDTDWELEEGYDEDEQLLDEGYVE